MVVQVVANSPLALSNLGRKAYLAYWSTAVARSVLSSTAKQISVRQLVDDTWILPEDVIAALKEMDVVEEHHHAKHHRVTVDRARLKTWIRENQATIEPLVTSDGFVEAFESGY